MILATAEVSAKPFGYLDTETNRTFVPLRYLSEHFQCEVIWDAEQQKIFLSREDMDIALTVGQHQVIVNGELHALDGVPFIDQDVTYVPLRFIGQHLQISLEWEAGTQAVVVQDQYRTFRLPIIQRGSLNGRKAIELTEKTFIVGSKQIRSHVLAIDLLNPGVQVTVGLARDKVGQVAELKQIADTNQAVAAVNGTFFDAYTDGDIQIPYGFIVSNGELVHPSTEKRSVLVVGPNTDLEIVSGDVFPARLQQGAVTAAIQAGPRLLTDGKITVNPEAEGFRDPKILTNSGARTALGITDEHYLLLVTTPAATIPELAEWMQKAGAVQAMNLDGGASSGLYYESSYITKPGRPISNALLIQYSDPEAD
ncbi:phosphodiester glycosidase family protein [Xylanibacillus composti]|uniref:Phosphodiester glycosidase family protein n=2 Tax=Xylanibacillus composti TaxID=1572762 RepID=A0A8J4GXZ2_9BACL|nr:phosphodiester glycosidase family protein [Xylanibacillus composti]